MSEVLGTWVHVQSPGVLEGDGTRGWWGRPGSELHMAAPELCTPRGPCSPTSARKGGGPGGSLTCFSVGIVGPGERVKGVPACPCVLRAEGIPTACPGFGLKSQSSASGLREAQNEGVPLFVRPSGALGNLPGE